MDAEESFRDYWGWKVIVDDISAGNPMIAEWWYSQPWIMFLNELSYLKEKNALKK